MEFQQLGRRRVIGRFDGGKISSDAGGLLLREVESRFQILKRLARDCFRDYRDKDRSDLDSFLAAHPTRTTSIGEAVGVTPSPEVVADLLVNLLAVQAVIGPGIGQILGPQAGITPQDVSLAHPQLP